ncbi:3-oxoacyl-[acyl-carrier-protein] synthase II [Erysipelotrichaceae bacterium]|nr:3-oxoacyl-[acyl-carrier-protein] synthase II [Erysipelotrichaceae bacterium]
MSRRVVVTGMGIISPLGNDVETYWQNIKNGEVGISLIGDRVPDMVGIKTKVAALVKDFNPADWVSRMEVRRYDLFTHYAMAASMQAMEHAGLDIVNINYDSERLGVAIGSGVGGAATWEKEFRNYLIEKKAKPGPLFIPMMLANMATGNVAIKVKAQGPTPALVTACAAATQSIGEAYRLIQHNYADMMLAGGTEAPITRLAIAGFEALTALSLSEDPLRASIPFDKDRNGFVMGEGSGVLMLEEYEHAKARGAKIHAEIIGYGITSDAHHMTSPDPEGKGASRAMQYAISEGGITPADIDYINAHGTSTPYNDAFETLAIKKVFGDHANKVAVSSTKSMVGHLLGASGGVEAIATIRALQEGFIPPTAGLEQTSEEMDLDYVPKVGRKVELKYAISNSFGFGGHNGTIALKKYEE